MAVELHERSLVADGAARVFLLAETAGAVVAFPQAALPARRGFSRDHAADLPFLTLLVDELRRAYPTPRDRVCISGMSGGARMACHFAWTHSDRVAAVGAVAGLRAGDEPAPERPGSRSCR
jgi:poly(3-hydroxybutyrate) depolymerase